MIAHAVGLIVTVAVIIFCTLLPFLPGGYDPLAVPMSAMAQTFGRVGLLLVPIGVVWFASRYSTGLARKRGAFAIATLAVGSLVLLILALVGLVHSGFILGIATLAVGAGIIWNVSRRLTASASASAALYLMLVPLAVLAIQLAIETPLTEFSRGRAIRNSAGLIGDIERYRQAHGEYPISLVALWGDYRPAIIGIRGFQYEKNGESYNVLFEPFTFRFGTREIVMFNPRDEHEMTSHDSDLLRRSPEQLQFRRGYYAVHDAPQPHWKYFWFD